MIYPFRVTQMNNNSLFTIFYLKCTFLTRFAYCLYLDGVADTECWSPESVIVSKLLLPLKVKSNTSLCMDWVFDKIFPAFFHYMLATTPYMFFQDSLSYYLHLVVKVPGLQLGLGMKTSIRIDSYFSGHVNHISCGR